MDRGSWQATVHGVSKSWTQLSTHRRNHTFKEGSHCLILTMQVRRQVFGSLSLMAGHTSITQLQLFQYFHERKLSLHRRQGAPRLPRSRPLSQKVREHAASHQPTSDMPQEHQLAISSPVLAKKQAQGVARQPLRGLTPMGL